LTTDLSRLTSMFVISRNSAFTYRNKPVDAKQIGRELGVRYILEGSVRRSGNQVRVNTQLIDAATDAHLWAERFDRDVGDLFALQNDITRQIAVALSAELVSAEAVRLTEHPDALDRRGRGADRDTLCRAGGSRLTADRRPALRSTRTPATARCPRHERAPRKSCFLHG